ncbi:hypothetical protein BDW22DRAFT_439017 [Trametopsis cervina]|nr:hypothetical protein BDW22DRAFT_439017 [Trametopsis cervina]
MCCGRLLDPSVSADADEDALRWVTYLGDLEREPVLSVSSRYSPLTLTLPLLPFPLCCSRVLVSLSCFSLVSLSRFSLSPSLSPLSPLPLPSSLSPLSLLSLTLPSTQYGPLPTTTQPRPTSDASKHPPHAADNAVSRPDPHATYELTRA